jgi:hydroxymethylglutaryl-CoA lyase
LHFNNSRQVLEQVTFPSSSYPRPQLACLVPNVKGLETALQLRSKVDEVAIFGAASEAFSQRNIGCSIDESMQRFRSVVEMAAQHRLPVRGYVSTVVACPYEGPIAPSQVAKVVEQLLELGCYEISLGDTIGVGTPGSIRAMLDDVLVSVYKLELCMEACWKNEELLLTHSLFHVSASYSSYSW